MKHFQRLTAFAVAVALTLPLSAFAENRSRGRTDLERTRAELERIFGAPTVSANASEEAILDAMNRERAAYGLRPLRLEQRLTRAAGDRANDMFAKHYFNHLSPDGIDPFSWVVQRGYNYSIVGENLALGYGAGRSVVDGWMRSPGHRANILQRDFDEVGIAIAGGSPTRGYRGPLIVALYGSR